MRTLRRSLLFGLFALLLTLACSQKGGVEEYLRAVDGLDNEIKAAHAEQGAAAPEYRDGKITMEELFAKVDATTAVYGGVEERALALTVPGSCQDLHKLYLEHYQLILKGNLHARKVREVLVPVQGPQRPARDVVDAAYQAGRPLIKEGDKIRRQRKKVRRKISKERKRLIKELGVEGVETKPVRIFPKVKIPKP